MDSKKRMGLVYIDVPVLASIIKRVLAGILASDYLGNLIKAVPSEQVLRRGSIDTLHENSSSYFIHLSLYFVCVFLGCWYATFGTKVRNGNEQTQSQAYTPWPDFQPLCGVRPVLCVRSNERNQFNGQNLVSCIHDAFCKWHICKRAA